MARELQIKPNETLAHLVYHLFGSAKELKEDIDNWRFAGGKKGMPAKGALMAIFRESFGTDLSKWKNGKGRNPNFPTSYTRRLINVFSNVDVAKGELKETGSLQNLAAIHEFWNDSKSTELQEVRKELQAFLSIALTAQSERIKKSADETARKLLTDLDAERVKYGEHKADSSGIRELVLPDFHKVEGEEFVELGRQYLRGRAPTPMTAVNVAVNRKDVPVVWNAAMNHEIVVVHGPIGEGVSTILLQVSEQALKAGRRVFYCSTPLALENIEHVVNWSEQPIIVVDGIESLESLPTWLLGFSGDKCGCVCLGTRTRHLRDLTHPIRSRNYYTYPVARLEESDVKPFVEAILFFGASPAGISADYVKKLFQSGLASQHGYAGLWPAQYQATKGELLDNRVKKLLESADDETKLIMAIISLLNGMHNFSNLQYLPKAYTDFMICLVYALDLSSEGIEKCSKVIVELPVTWAGEVKMPGGLGYSAIQNNPVLEFRHPTLTDAVFRWSFGAKHKERGIDRFWRWSFYGPILETISQLRANGAVRSAFAVVKQMARDYDYALRRKGELVKKLTMGAEFSKHGDIILHVVEKFEALFFAEIGELHWLSRNLNVIKAEVHELHQRQGDPQEADLCKSFALLALVNAEEEHDAEILFEVAELSRRNLWSGEGADSKELDWRKLNETAVIVSADNRKLKAKCTFLWRLIVFGDISDFERVNELVLATDYFKQPLFDSERLTQLRILLSRARHGLVQGEAISLPFESYDSALLGSVQAIYREFWRELVTFRKNFPKDPVWNGSFKGQIGGVVNSVLDDWKVDCERNQSLWNPDIVKLVNQVINDDTASLNQFVDAFVAA